jgi:O-antigen/teichoic acid export membrane protein
MPADTPAAHPSGRSVFKDALQGTGIYFVPLLAQRVVGLVLLPIISGVLAISDYGMLSLLENVSSVLSLLLCGNFTGALGFFYFQEGSETQRRRVSGTSAFGALGLGCAASLICWPFTGLLATYVFGTPAAVAYLHLVWLFLPGAFLVEALFGWLRVVNQPVRYAIGSLIRIAVTAAGLLILVVHWRMGVVGFQYSTLLALWATIPPLVWWFWRGAKPRFDPSLFARMMKFALPLVLSGLAMFVINFGDQFMLKWYRNASEVGVYALAYKIGMLVSFAYGSFHSYWSAQVFGIVKRPDAQTLFGRLFTYVVLGLATVSLGLILFSDAGLHLLQKDYRGAARIIPLIVAAYFVRSIGEFVRCLFLAAGKPGYEATINWIGAAICVTAYFLLIPAYGMWGAAIATDITFAFIVAFSIVWTYRLNPYRVEAVRLLKIGVAAGAPLAGYFLVPVHSLLLQVAWDSTLMAAFPLLLWALHFPTPGEWEMLWAVLRRLRGAPSAVHELF